MSLRVIEWGVFLSPSFQSSGPSAMTIGVFDGVHRGHTELIRQVVRHGTHPTVVTFRENPKKFLGFQNYPGDIFTLEQKFEVFENLGIEQVILIDFSGDFSKIKGQEFIRLLEDRGNLNLLVIGSNFRCGCKLDTGASLIKSMNEAKGIPTEIIPPVWEGNALISSSRIRNAIIRGDLSLAAALLGRNVELAVPRNSQYTAGEEGLVLDVSGRLLPPPGHYRTVIRDCRQTRERDVIISEGKALILFRNNIPPDDNPNDLERSGELKIEFLSGPEALKRFPI